MASLNGEVRNTPKTATPSSLRCEICGRDFNRGEHLRRHRRIHTREKPFECHCGRAFARRDLLKRHERLHHAADHPSSPTVLIQHNQRPSSTTTTTTTLDTFTDVFNGHTDSINDGQSSIPDLGISSSNTHAAATTLYSLMNQPNEFLHRSDSETDCNEIMQGLSGFLTNNVGLDVNLDFSDLSGVDPFSCAGPARLLPSPASTMTPDTVSTSNVQATRTNPGSTPGKIPIVSNGDDDFDELKPFSQPWKVSEQERRQFAKTLEPFSPYSDRFMLPSRLSMARYVAGFVDGFTHHHPFIHMPTFRITNYSHSPELVLAMLAIGAQYRYEYPRALSLYRAGRSIILRRMQSGELSRMHSALPVSRAHNLSLQTSPEPSASMEARIHVIGAMLLLSTFASWQADPAMVRESREYQPLLVSLVRDCGLSETEPTDGDDWLEWSQKESGRRTKLCVFTFLNLQSIAFQLPPVLLSNEIDLRLPTSCKEWLAPDQESWIRARAESIELACFHDMLGRLCDDDTAPIAGTSPFGNFVLIHALLQRLTLSWMFKHTALVDSGHLHQGRLFDKSLQRWRDAWHIAPESVLDLKNSKGSLAWSATSLLGLAHIRVYFDLGRGRQTQTLDPELIAAGAHAAKPPQRGPHLIHALLHSVHALSIPAQLGINYLAHCQAFFWSIQHAFCFFECAVFLSKWLLSLSSEDTSNAISQSESQILDWAVAIVAEVQASLGEVSDESGLPPILISTDHATHPDKIGRLAISVVDIFAQMFHRSNGAWPITSIIGQSLEAYARILRDELAVYHSGEVG